MNVLITGSNGQLGSEIREISKKNKNFNFFFQDLPDLDICDFNKLQTYIVNNNIKAVINCAAYTDVESAEHNSELAENINFKGVCNLINALIKVKGKLIHISTDYVFDGNNSIPYNESHVVNPIGVYGKSKRAGEVAVLNSSLDAIIIRTSWLYSSFGNNFVKKILSLAKDQKSLKIIADQFGTPTNANDLAEVCINILYKISYDKISKNGKVYHYSNEGIASWYEFAIAIIEFAEMKCEIQPIKSKDYFTLASRPKYSVLDKKKIKNDFKFEIPHWRESLADCINKIKTLS
tara:strand:- start:965 stop:1840 length:876 start_codon:yes stop_codon:yes gene_type:complete